MGVEVSDTAGLAGEPATLVPPARGIDSSAGGPGITGSARLALIGALLCELHQADIHYCHWKSNEHLAASLEGKTDLDLLVAPADLGPLAGILLNLGFKRCVTVEGRGYPGIESYLGLDDATGTLVHLHLHYQLTIGERFLKGYRVP